MPNTDIQQQMREDWDCRAREDAHYYVAFSRRHQTAEEFFATAGEVPEAVKIELRQFPASTDPQEMAVLEIGCGPGRLMVPLSRLFGRITGVDVSPEMVELARRNLQGIPHARAEVTSGSDLLAFEDESFDLCYSYAVFQHSPTREVIFNYLREAWRVLKVGGILKCQFNGLPGAPKKTDTWSGVRFRPEEIREFCRKQDFQLLLLDGENTLNMWMTARKQPAGWGRSLEPVPGAQLLRVTNARTSDAVVSAGGPFSCASLWAENLTGSADINNLEVEIADRRVLPFYAGGFYPAKSLSQVNAFLPDNPPTGLLQVRLRMLGRPISNFALLRVIPRPPAVPRLMRVTDGINLISAARIETRSLKVHLEEIVDASTADFSADVDGVSLANLDLFCADPRSGYYVLDARVPDEIPQGHHVLTVRLSGRAFRPVEIVIADTELPR